MRSGQISITYNIVNRATKQMETQIMPQPQLTTLCLSLNSSKKTKMEGNEAKLYAIWTGRLEFKA